MTDKNRARHSSQIVVVVTIAGIDDESQAYYTYTDNQNSSVHVLDEESQVRAVVPYHTLYALDYASTRAGWRFDEHIIHVSGPKETEHHRTDNEMGMITIHDDHETHRFRLKFFNKHTEAEFTDDPQEANVKQPT